MRLIKSLFMALALSLPNFVFAVALTDGDEIDHIVAIVNDSLITRSELDQQTNSIITRLQQSGRPMPPRSAIEQQVLEQMISQQLQLNEAEKLGIAVTPDMLATAINNIAKNNGLTLPEMRASLESEGISFKTFRNKLKKKVFQILQISSAL